MNNNRDLLVKLLRDKGDTLVSGWLAKAGVGADQDSFASKLSEAREIIAAYLSGIEASGGRAAFDGAGWENLARLLTGLSASRAAQGQSAGETSMFVLSLKKPVFAAFQQTQDIGTLQLLAEIDAVTEDVDRMAQLTAATYQKTREELITRQQHELMELSTPVIKLWEGVLAAPMIGTLDSARTQLVMESLLQRIVETESALAIIDITGVPTVDTLVAQHLLKTVTAIRLMGADCIISGIRPQIAQTIVHLGIDLQGVTSKATLADALALALKRTGYVVARKAAAV